MVESKYNIPNGNIALFIDLCCASFKTMDIGDLKLFRKKANTNYALLTKMKRKTTIGISSQVSLHAS